MDCAAQVRVAPAGWSIPAGGGPHCCSEALEKRMGVPTRHHRALGGSRSSRSWHRWNPGTRTCALRGRQVSCELARVPGRTNRAVEEADQVRHGTLPSSAVAVASRDAPVASLLLPRSQRDPRRSRNVEQPSHRHGGGQHRSRHARCPSPDHATKAASRRVALALASSDGAPRIGGRRSTLERGSRARVRSSPFQVAAGRPGPECGDTTRVTPPIDRSPIQDAAPPPSNFVLCPRNFGASRLKRADLGGGLPRTSSGFVAAGFQAVASAACPRVFDQPQMRKAASAAATMVIHITTGVSPIP
jgi:hypothetical protein